MDTSLERMAGQQTNENLPGHVHGPQSQNEFITLIGDAIRSSTCALISKSALFSIMADTTPDLSHKDQISLVVRIGDENFDSFERLVKIDEITDKTGD